MRVGTNRPDNGGHVPIVYIAGDAPGVGVTATATGIAAHFGSGVTIAKAASFRAPDPDVEFHRALHLDAGVPPGWPALLSSTSNLDRDALRPATSSLSTKLTVVEGVSGAPTPADRSDTDSAIAEALDARVLLVTSPTAADPEGASAVFGDRLQGVIINRVPIYGAQGAKSDAQTAFEEKGIPVLGCVQEDRLMLAPTVRSVAEHLGAECINAQDLDEPDAVLDALVEHFMLGGLFLDAGVYVFGRREQKAVIVRGDRPDLQMAALETSTVCLLLTEGQMPVQYIVHHAALNQVPMLLVKHPTIETMGVLDSIGERASVHSAHKARRFGDLLSTHCDLTSLAQSVA
jgi:hypothetical protein